MKTTTVSRKKSKVPPASAPAMESAALPARKYETWSVGDCTMQGDLIFVAIPKPDGLRPRANPQLADGNTTGSRHVVTRGECYDADPAMIVKAIKGATGRSVEPAYVGPVCGPSCYVSHPQHQHKDFAGDCYTAVVFQRNLDAEERAARARD